MGSEILGYFFLLCHPRQSKVSIHIPTLSSSKNLGVQAKIMKLGRRLEATHMASACERQCHGCLVTFCDLRQTGKSYAIVERELEQNPSNLDPEPNTATD